MPSMKEPKWSPLPPKIGGRGVSANKMALKLAQRKGKWAIIAVYDKQEIAGQRASRIRNGHMRGFKMVGKFEAEARQTSKGWAVYVRCVGYSAAYARHLDKNDPDNWVVDPNTIEESDHE